MLGRAICGDIGVAGQARGGSDVDEARADAVSLEVRQRRMRDIVDAREIDRQHMRAQSSASVLSNEALGASPALFTRIETGPNAARARSSPRPMATGSVTSKPSMTIAAPAGSDAAIVSSGSRRRPARATFAPAAASARAMAPPMPPPAPVTSACRSESSATALTWRSPQPQRREPDWPHIRTLAAAYCFGQAIAFTPMRATSCSVHAGSARCGRAIAQRSALPAARMEFA